MVTLPGERRITLSSYPWQARGFGLLFAGFGLIGVIVMLTSARPVPPPIPAALEETIPGFSREQQQELVAQSSPAAMAWIPGIFVAVGLGIALVRYRVVLDVDRRVRVTTGGWGPFLTSSEIALEGLTSIEVAPAEERGTGSGQYTAIPVAALGSGPRRELAVARSVEQARQLGHTIAEALNLPLVDSLGASASTGAGQGLDAETAAAALAALQLPSAQAMAPPTADELRPPDATPVRIEELSQGIRIRYPVMRRGTAGRIMSALVPITLASAFWYWFWRPLAERGLPAGHVAGHVAGHAAGQAAGQVSQIMLYAPLVLGALPLVIALAAAVRSGVMGGTIRVDSQEGLRAAGRRVSPERILAIQVLPSDQEGGGLKILLEHGSFVIARGQREMDLRFIRALLLQHLRS